MAKRQREWAVRRRRRLIQELGGKCVHCDERDEDELTVDHIDGRTWDLNAKCSSARVSRYCREAKEGKLQVLCKSCNAKKRHGMIVHNGEVIEESENALEDHHVYDESKLTESVPF